MRTQTTQNGDSTEMHAPGAHFDLFAGPGEMRARFRTTDWGATPLGAAERWPAALRTAVRLMLDAPLATALWCGPEYTLLYNDAYRPILGVKHPAALGRSGAVVWDELWPELEDKFEGIRAGGPGVFAEEARLVMQRLEGGRAEDAWFTYAISPLTDEAGRCIAVYNVAVETTDKVRAEAERARLAAEAAAERAGLEALVLHMPAPVALLVGPEHRHALVNDAFRRISGGGRDVTGLTVREAFPELEGQGIHERLDRVFETGEAWAAPESLVRYDRDGTGVMDTWFDVRFEPVRDADGRVTGILNFAVDVTAQVLARRDMERLLAESERARSDAESARERTEAVLASIADAFYLLDREWRFTYVNDAAEPLLQTTREALLGRSLWDAFPGVIGSPFEGPYREAMATGRATSAEAYFPPLGTWFDVHTYAWAGGLMVHFRDIGARKAAEEERERLLRALEVERARLADVFRRAPSFIVAFRGAELVYEFVNEAYYQLVGHREIIGKPLLEAIPEIRGQGFETILEGVRQSGEPWVGRETPVLLQRTPGAPLETRYLDMVFQPLTEADGTRSGVVVHGSDITAQVLARRDVERLLGESERARAEAEAARGDAEAANRAKGEFLAVMSHELRTPLNAIGGYAELMELGLRGPVTEQQRADLTRIQQSQRHLLGLINQVLNYTRIDAGAVRYDVTDVPMSEALAAAEALIIPQVRARGLTFVLGGATPGLAVRADREKLQQILLNLLSNAIKFTEPGGEVRVACVEQGESVAISVGDTGVGIAPEKLASIFEPFVQVDQRLTRSHEGVGLGLAISRDLARGMGGNLVATSAPGTGSVFTLTVPRVQRA
jgi:PAS domain S-box-containing protein